MGLCEIIITNLYKLRLLDKQVSYTKFIYKIANSSLITRLHGQIDGRTDIQTILYVGFMGHISLRFNPKMLLTSSDSANQRLS